MKIIIIIKEVINMPRGFGRGWGAFGWFGYPFWGWGRGNPFPFCRWFPWLPRWWWATPYAGYYLGTIPYFGYPFGTGWSQWPGYGYQTGATQPQTGKSS